MKSQKPNLVSLTKFRYLKSWREIAGHEPAIFAKARHQKQFTIPREIKLLLLQKYEEAERWTYDNGNSVIKNRRVVIDKDETREVIIPAGSVASVLSDGRFFIPNVTVRRMSTGESYRQMEFIYFPLTGHAATRAYSQERY